ncbi:MAG: GDP-L-fucose synthase [Terriglobales bacterium]|jgi:GDP-L-fucose synthase
MQRHEPIYIAGHNGLVGSALLRNLRAAGYSNLVTADHRDLDLTAGDAVRSFFQASRPAYVFLAAARVGGILANSTRPAEFIVQNLGIELNVIREAYAAGVKRLLFLGSSCVYPKDCPQPIQEEYLLTGRLETTNQAFAMAKITGIEMCRALNFQYATKYIAAMATNLYGPDDNYDLQDSHVIPALVRKMHEAKTAKQDSVVVWGTGSPRREFLHVDDLANACVFLMQLPPELYDAIARMSPPIVNVGSGEDITIAELATLVQEIVGSTATIRWDHEKPDGTPRKLLATHRMRALGWAPLISLREGIAATYREYIRRIPS